ncbi:CYP2D6 (predicted) [Pycnogonum litorale]
MDLILNGIIFGCFAVLVSIYLFKNSKRKGRMPPGPPGLPILGNLIQMIDDPCRFMETATKEYGPVYSLALGSRSFFVISDYDVMKTAMKMNVFQGRVKDGAIATVRHDLGIIAATGPLWQENRRFVLHSLRDRGMGKLQMEDRIKDELQNLIENMKTCDGKPTDFKSRIETSSANIICQLAFGNRFEYNDARFVYILENLTENIKLLLRSELLSSFKTWLYPLYWYVEHTLIKNRLAIMRSLSDIIDDRKAAMDDGNDVINLYLQEIKLREGDPVQRKYFHEKQLMEICFDLFAAGTETSSTTIRWALLYMSEHLDVQKKVQHEMDEIVGRSRTPSLQDKNLLHYSQAVLQEVERIASIAPFSVLHSTLDEVDFQGWTLPKYTTVMCNLYSVHHSKEIWGDPYVFRPSRFLDKDGHVFRPEHVIPFGTGKRICPGESLAKVEIFLYFTNLLHVFTWSAVPGEPTTESKGSISIVRSPAQYKIVARSRPLD